jgi:hypothetical protein
LYGIKRYIWHFQLYTTTLLGHLLKGEFWIIKSIVEYVKNIKKINESRLKIKNFQENCSSKIQLEDIINLIKESIKNKKINWL